MKDEKIRLNKFIASTGLCSRRDADKLIEAGKVLVNGEKVTDFSLKVSRKDKIKVAGKDISKKDFVYIRYYKPAGYITTCDDEKGRKTIYDVLPPEVAGLKPVGRLDKDSTGLLIMTNDGDLINKMTHPRIKIPKVYRVEVEGKIKHSDLVKWEEGLVLDDGKTAYAYAYVLEFKPSSTVLCVTLFQGLNRQIRKMADLIKHPVISLKRVRHGCVDLTGLKKGAFKYIKPAQLKELKAYLKKAEKESEKS